MVNLPATSHPAVPGAGESTQELVARAVAASDMPMLVLDASVDGLGVLWANPVASMRTGYALEAMRAAPRGLLADPRVRLLDGAEGHLDEALRGRRPVEVSVEVRRPDGTVLMCSARLAPVRGGPPTDVWVVVLRDIGGELSREARRAAEVAEERRERQALSVVAQVSDLLVDVDDPHALGEIVALLRSTTVDWAAFYLNDGGLRAADGIEPDRPPTGVGRRHLAPDVPADRAAPAAELAADPVQQLLDGHSERPVELDVSEGARHVPGSASDWLARHGRPSDGEPYVVVYPVSGRRRVMGLLVVRGRCGSGLAGLDGSTRTVLELTAHRVGLSVDNVRLYEREHRLAEALQRAMLPEQAEVEGLDVWTYYAPNSANVQVGGDWYDVLQITPDVVGVVIGDVVGHDVEAAATMGQLRSVVRSYGFDVTVPGPVLERVDQLVAGLRTPRSAALVFSTLTRADGRWVLAYCRAGHLPMLLVRQGHARPLADAAGPLVGFGGGARSTATVELEPGDSLVYFTDGLIERRDRGLREGLAALVDAAAAVTATDAAGIGEDLLARLADQPEDDVAVVVVRVPDAAEATDSRPSPRRRRWALPNEAASIARARHAVVRTCQAWDIADAANAELVVSELVANAVLHGWGRVALQLYDTGDGLRIEVEDANPTPPVATDGHPGRVGGFGMQIVERLADWGWRPARGGKVVWAKLRPGSLPETAASSTTSRTAD